MRLIAMLFDEGKRAGSGLMPARESIGEDCGVILEEEPSFPEAPAR